MNEYDLLRALGDADETYIEAANKETKPARRPRWGALAACLAVLFLAGGVFAAAAEAKEYRAAVDFFEKNSLSAEGLTRSEIKKVYRDITAGHFTYGKTAEVITNSVPGYELPAPEVLSPEALKSLLETIRNTWTQKLPVSGYSYKTDCVYKEDPALGFETFEKSALECYKDGVLLWTADFDAFVVDGCAHTAQGTAVWGWGFAGGDFITNYALLANVDEAGNVRWVKQVKNGFTHEFICAVLDGGSGTFAVISRGNLDTLCFGLYDKNGNPLSVTKTEIGNMGILRAARLGDGYLVQLYKALTRERDRIVKLDSAGNLTDSFTYTADDCDYYITDMTEFGGHVYLSAYATPKQTDEGGRDEIADILDDIFAREAWEISEEELTPMVQQNYTAVLLLCDPEGGAPQTFYAVPGALGGEMRVSDAGELEWEAQRLESAFFSPATDSFTIGGVCRIVRYTFDSSGALIKQEDTQETVGYHR